MHSRLGPTGALAFVALLAGAAPENAQEPPAKRLSAIVGVAVEEYAKGVDARGRIISAVELEEATGFLKDAQEVARRLAPAAYGAVRGPIDSLVAATGRRSTPAEVGKFYALFVAALGAEGALDLPSRAVDFARGKSIYLRDCASCHGAGGGGDGAAGRGLNPPPAPIGQRDAMHDVSPALMYRIVTVGIQGTTMAGWASRLSPDERWDVVAYINSLRAADADRAKGTALLEGRCTACAARAFEWQAERSDSQIVSALRSGDASLGVKGGATLSPAEAHQVVAALRAAPVVSPALAASAGTRKPAFDPRDAARQVRRLVDDAIAAARESRVSDAGDLAFDAYIAFEPLEGPARLRKPGLVAAMERHFADFKGAVKAGDVAAAESERDRIEAGLPAVLELATPSSTWWGSFLESFLIILREGFEAILVLGAVVAFLIKTGNRARLREIWWGAGAGLAASAVLALLMRTVLAAMPASREVIEGATMLVAVVVLFSVSYWLISKVEGERWQKFIRAQVNTALSHGGGLALALVAFLAVFREGAETALFYQALFARGTVVLTPVSLGLLLGLASLGVIFTLFYRFGIRIPLRPFFAVTSGLLYYMAFVFAGKGIRELQEGDAVSRTVIPGFPHFDFIGLYPTVESLTAQGILVALLVFALWRTLSPAPPDEPDELAPASQSAVPPEVAARLAELRATAQRLQDRVDTLEKETKKDGEW